MASRRAVAALAARGAGNPEQMAAWLANRARQGRNIQLASPRYPVAGPDDILIGRSPDGGATVRHRRGGALIGQIQYQDGWRANGGKPHTHQRGALAELLGLWNSGTTTPERAAPLQPPPVQTELMAQYGVPAIRALATPAASVSDGGRITLGNGSDDDDDDSDSGNGNGNGGGNGLGPRGQSVYKKLKAKGWPDAKALKFAQMAEKNQGKIGSSS